MQRLKHFEEQFAKVFGRLFHRLERPGRPDKSLRGDSIENRPRAALEVSMDRGRPNLHGACELSYAKRVHPGAVNQFDGSCGDQRLGQTGARSWLPL